MDQQLSYAKLSTRSATTSVQFNFDANGAMYRSTTICVEEGTMRLDGDSSSSGSSGTADSSCFATFQPLSTDDYDDDPSDSSRFMKRSAVRDSNNLPGYEDPLTYFSPTTSTRCDENEYAVHDPEPLSCSQDEEDPTELADPVPAQDGTACAAAVAVGGSSPTSQQKLAKGNPLDPDAEDMEDDDQTKKFFSF